MASNLNYKQVVNVTRRTWDKESYEKKAQARTKALESGVAVDDKDASSGSKRPLDNAQEEDNKPEFLPAAPGAKKAHNSKRALLQARKQRVDVDSKVGNVELVSADAVATNSIGSIKDGVEKSGVGWHCRVCDCFLKDSHTYLDHINGRKHQRKLGYSMKVERSTKEQVSARLAQLAMRKEQSETAMLSNVEENFEDVVKQKDELAQRRKEERAKQRKERKQHKKMEQKAAQKDAGDSDEEEEYETEGVDPNIAAMMGFSGFGSG